MQNNRNLLSPKMGVCVSIRPHRVKQLNVFAPRKPLRHARILRSPCIPALSRETMSYRVTHPPAYKPTYTRARAHARFRIRISRTLGDRSAAQLNRIWSNSGHVCGRLPAAGSADISVVEYFGHIADKPAYRRVCPDSISRQIIH